MSTTADRQTDYATMLDHWSATLAFAQTAALLPDLQPGNTAADVERYLANSNGERLRMLAEELQFAALAFDDLSPFFREYLQQCPWWGAGTRGRAAATLGVASEGAQFLKWLSARGGLTPAQRDLVAYQLAEYRCVERAAAHPDEHRRFQRNWQATRWEDEMPRDFGATWLVLNPIRTWTRMRWIDNSSEEPATGNDSARTPGQAPRRFGQRLVCFASNAWVTSLAPDGEQHRVIRALAQWSPSTVRGLILACSTDSRYSHPALDEGDLHRLCRPLVSHGLVAVVADPTGSSRVPPRRRSSLPKENPCNKSRSTTLRKV